MAKINAKKTEDLGLKTKSLFSAVRDANLESAKAIIRVNPDSIYEIDEKTGWTPLHCACYYQSKELIELLLERPNESVHLADKSGRWPIHYMLICQDLALISRIENATFPENKGLDHDPLEKDRLLRRFVGPQP